MKITYYLLCQNGRGFQGVLYFILFLFYFLKWREHVNTGNVWTVAVSGKKELWIQKYPDTSKMYRFRASSYEPG